MVSASPAITSSPAAPKRRRRRGVRTLSRRDVVVLTAMIGIPLLGVLFFVWFPAVATVFLSFTKWNGIGGIKAIRADGVQNYVQAATNYPPFWPAVRHNILWLVVFLVIASPLGK